MGSLNKKITELTALLVADDTDLLVIVDDVAGVPTTKKITVGNFVSNIQPVFKKLVATAQNAGNLDLLDANWDTSKVMIAQIKITADSGTSTDFDIYLYEKDTFLADSLIFESKGHNLNSGANILIGTLPYQDIDAGKKIHLKIVDNDGTGIPKFNIELRGWGLN